MNSTLGQLSITPLTQDEAETIASWHYEPPYDFYDATADHRDLAKLLDPAQRGDRYFSGRDVDGELIGYFGFGCNAEAVGVGAGLRPDLTGQGLGLAFLQEGLAFARERFTPRRFRLFVAEFNERAIKVYERAGFMRTRTFVHETNAGSFVYVEMERPA